MMRIFLFIGCFLSFISASVAQQDTAGQSETYTDIILDYQDPVKYTLSGISVRGNGPIKPNIVKAYSGLEVGEQVSIPGEKISNAIKNLWKQELFADVAIKVDDVNNRNLYLLIEVQTRPRLSKFKIKGASKNDASDIRDKIKLVRGDIVTKQLIQNVKRKIKDYYEEDGYLKAEVDIEKSFDTASSRNTTTLIIDIDQGDKIKIKNINFSGNKQFKDRKLRRKLEETNQKSLLNLFKSAKFHPDKYESDKQKLINFYNKKGYRDAKIVSDSVYFISEDRINIDITIDRGEKYYFRNISWTGNTKYDTETLDEILGIEKGDVYNTELLNSKLKFNQRGLDISSLYMDNGYLFFNVQPVETKVVEDSIDVEIRIREGAQATVDEVTVTGNTKTSDEVILREIRTRPGEKFSRSDIIRSQRELSQLGYFDPQKMEVNPKPNPEDGTVDINYKVSEKPSDKVELQGGWGAGQLVGSLGFVFNNFSLSKLTDFSEWRPLPSGDGQKLSVRAYSNGRSYTSFNFSFTEPWFGGRNPNSLTVSAFHSIQSNGAQRGEPNRRDFRITGFTVGLGKRLKWPDDYFTLNNEISFQKYTMNDFNRFANFFDKGESFNISLKHKLSRNSVDRPIYPKSGSKFSFSVQYTPPYSSFDDVDYEEASVQRKFKWMEFHKWKFSASDFMNIAGDLVLNSKAEHGYLGYYNNDIGLTPFERFYVGGDGLTGYSLDGRELIRLRGYGDNALTAPGNRNASENNGASIYTKYTMELRYPITLQKQATIYVLGYGEAGNSWLNFDEYNPFDVYRSAGAGVRIYLPMFGKLGLDWGYGFDKLPFRQQQASHFHISIGQQF